MFKNQKKIKFIEVLVVAGIAALSIGISLLDFLKARESARKATCSDNLRRIGLALSSYASIHRAFPLGIAEHGSSPHAALLDALELRPLWSSINFAEGMDSASNSTSFARRPDLYSCPSDPGSSALPGRTSYAGNAGRGVPAWGWDGLFSTDREDRFVVLSSATDGLATTAAFAEWRLAPRGGATDRRWSVAATATLKRKPEEWESFVRECMESPFVDLSGDKGDNWLQGGLMATLYNHAIPPNGPSCTNAGYVREGAYSAGSAHRAGAHVLFGDGHVSFQGDGVHAAIWQALGSRAANDPVTSDRF